MLCPPRALSGRATRSGCLRFRVDALTFPRVSESCDCEHFRPFLGYTLRLVGLRHGFRQKIGHVAVFEWVRRILIARALPD